MPTPKDINDPTLREKVETAFAEMRAGKGTDAVRTLADSFLYLLELKPALLQEKIAMRNREIPRVMRWPALGANIKLDSVIAGKPEIEFIRERFSVSEAMTYYQFVLDEALEKNA
ncbi:MAG TPA: hypothetical protein VJ998_07525 [Pseudomonadales bacterium]|nr:hypothetical protein [Pseudomonadales bacterium]